MKDVEAGIEKIKRELSEFLRFHGDRMTFNAMRTFEDTKVSSILADL